MRSSAAVEPEEGSRDVSAGAGTAGPLLTVTDLAVAFQTGDGLLTAVRGTSWSVDRGETVVILGESGSGKSVSAHAIAGLLPSNAVISGSVTFMGQDLIGRSARQLREVRTNHVGMIFQDPLSALNPCFTVGDQVAEIFRVHRKMSRKEAARQAVDLLDTVKIAEPRRRAGQYPHELSGGMRQRVMIAMALSLKPGLLLADEPTTALDTSVRGSILRTISDMRDELGIGVLLITHDVGVAAAVADRVAVMYAGRIVEYGDSASVLRDPWHPYSAALLASMPRVKRSGGGELPTIAGTPPSLREVQSGCAFAPRCSFALDVCRSAVPTLRAVGAPGHTAACHRAEELHDDGVLVH